MTANAVQSATYSDIKVVKSRGQFQIVLEAPLEQMARFIEMFGAPCPGAEIPVALARLVTAKPDAEPPVTTSRAKLAYLDASDTEKAVTRAAMMCADPVFQSWISVSDEKAAAAWLRKRLNVRSRSDIKNSPEAFEDFVKIETDWKVYSGQMPEIRG